MGKSDLPLPVFEQNTGEGKIQTPSASVWISIAHF